MVKSLFQKMWYDVIYVVTVIIQNPVTQRFLHNDFHLLRSLGKVERVELIVTHAPLIPLTHSQHASPYSHTNRTLSCLHVHPPHRNHTLLPHTHTHTDTLSSLFRCLSLPSSTQGNTSASNTVATLQPFDDGGREEMAWH